MNLYDIVTPMTMDEAKESYKPVTKPVPQPRKLNPGWALDPTTKQELKRRRDLHQRQGVDEEQQAFEYNVRCDSYDKGNFVDKDDAIASAQKMIYGGEKEYTKIEVKEIKSGDIIWEWHGKKDVDEDAWFDGKDEWAGGDNAWSSGEDQWAKEGVDYDVALTNVDEDSSDFMANDSTSPVGGNMQFEARLSVGDPVIVTAPNAYEGKTGEIAEFSPSGRFVIVNLYNHGEHSMHLSDVEYNQYADEEDELDEGFQDFNKREPYAVCLAGKPVKKFDYYEDARRFHDNWKKKLYNQGEKAKADTITLMPLNLDEATPRHFGPKGAGTELARQTRQAEIDRKFNTPDQLKKDADYRDYRAGIKKSKVVAKKSQVKEFAPGGTMKPPAPPTAKKKDPFEDDDRSQLLMSIKNLLDKGAKIDSYLFGARGHITGVSNDYFGFYFKKLNKPHSKSSFVRPMDGEDDESYMLKLVKPGYYQLWDKSIADAGEQGVAEVKQRLDAKCWAGKHKEGTKIKGGVRVNNCVPNESVEEAQTDYEKRRAHEKQAELTNKPKKTRQPSNDYFARRAKEKRDLERFGESTDYWAKLQNERNTRLNSLVDELSESVKNIK